MNLSKFKKIKEDKKTAHMKNDEGHILIIAKAALPSLQRKALEKLPLAEENPKDKKFDAGGEVQTDPSVARQKAATKFKWSPKFSDDTPPEKTAESGSDSASTVSNYFRDNKAEGGEVQPKGYEENKDPQEHRPRKLENFRILAPAMADGGPVSEESEPKAAEQAVADKPPMPQAPVNITINGGASSAPAPSVTQVPPAQPTSQIQTNAAPEAKYPHTGGLEGEARNTLKAVQQGEEAIQDQSKISAESGMQQAIQQDSYIKKANELAQKDLANIQELKTHTDDYKDYINQHPIDAQRYINNLGGTQKVSNAIGLLLGGFGGPNNPAMSYLQKQIDNDITVQKDNAANQNNVWAAYDKLYGNQNVASNLAKVSANDILAHQIQLTAARLGTAQAAANAKAATADIELKNQQLRAQAAALLGAQRSETTNKSINSASSRPGEVSLAPGIPDMQKAQEAAEKDNPHKIDKFVASPIKPILKSDAEQMKYAAYQNPNVDKGLFDSQFTGAYSADQALQRLPETFTNIYNETSAFQKFGSSIPSGLTGLGITLGTAIGHPVAGGSIGESVAQVLKPYLNNDQTRRYAAEVQNLVGYISSSLGNRGDQFVEHAVRSYVPDLGDSAKTLDAKYKGLQHYIKLHAPKDQLKSGKVTNPEE